MYLNESDVKGRPWPEAFTYISRFGFLDAPSHFAKVICTTLPIHPEKAKIIDIGCGSGIVGLYALVKKGATFVTFSDIQSVAMTETVANAVRLLESKVGAKLRPEQMQFLAPGPFTSLKGDLVSSHDMLVFNPPQLPTNFLKADELLKLDKSSSRATFRLGGPDGLKVVKEFLLWYSYLEGQVPPATILLSSFLGYGQIAATIRHQGLTFETKTETVVPLRKILVDAAESFSETERVDRGLNRAKGGGWTKRLLTLSVSRE